MIKTPEQKLTRNPQNAGYTNPLKSYDVPAKDNPDGTINVHAQPVYGIDPNREPIDLYMACRTVPGGLITGNSLVAGIGATGLVAVVPAGKKWQVFQLSTDTTMTATVGNRILCGFVVNAAGAVVWVGPNTAAITAAQVGGYDVGFGAVVTPNTTVRRQLAAAASTNVQVTCSCPITTLPAGWSFGIDDNANIDNADSVTFRYTYVEYDA